MVQLAYSSTLSAPFTPVNGYKFSKVLDLLQFIRKISKGV
jgi:hypothetical protein